MNSWSDTSKEDEGILFKCDPSGDIKELPDYPKDKASLQYLGRIPPCYRACTRVKTDSGWRKLIELTRILNEEPQKLDSIFQHRPGAFSGCYFQHHLVNSLG